VANHPLEQGAYTLVPASGDAKVILVGTGSEVALCVEAAKVLESEGIAASVVSMPSWFLFEQQTSEYQTSVFPSGVPVLSVEAGSTFGWAKYSTAQVGIDQFGVSGPAGELFKEFGFSVENVVLQAKGLL
jgi:transketolase